MEQDYVVWSTRGQGWWTHAGNTSTDFTQAKHFGRAAAMAFCAKHRSATGYGLLPIAMSDLEALSDQR